jgi:hypothetical protein
MYYQASLIFFVSGQAQQALHFGFSSTTGTAGSLVVVSGISKSNNLFSF